MSWQADRKPISNVIGQLSNNSTSQRGGFPELTTLYTYVSQYHVNIVQDLTDSSVDSITISSSKKEAIAKVKLLLEQQKVKIYSCGQFWICAEYAAYKILSSINQCC